MSHPLALTLGAYLGTMSGVLAWAWTDWYVHVYRPAHR